MKLTKRESRLVLIAIFSVALLVYYFYYLTPLLDEFYDLKQIVLEKEEKLGNLSQTEAEEKTLKSKIEEYKNQIADLENILPSNMRLPEIIVTLEQMANDSGVQLQGIVFNYDNAGKGEKLNTEVKEEKRDYLEIPLELNISGAYENELDFLKLLEASTRLYKVSDISVIQDFKASVENIRLNIGLSTFCLLHNNQLLSDFETYDFMSGEYGKTNPFTPINAGTSKGQASSSPNINNKTNPKDQNIDFSEFMEEFIKVFEN